MSANHFITVSKQGVLLARRKGGVPVAVATAKDGLVVETDRPELGAIRVMFMHGGGNRRLHVTDIVEAGFAKPVGVFQTEHGVTDETLGTWIRAAVERALETSPRRS
jgi:hypothetical protein